MDLTLRDIFLLLPELATSVAALIVIGSDLAFKKRDAVLWLAMIGLFVSFLFTIVLWFDGHAGGAEMGFNSSLIIDKFALFFKFLILGTLALVLLAAREAGLGTALTTLLCVVEPQVKELLGIPEDVSTAAMVTMGWPVNSFPKKLTRRPLSDFAFTDHYDRGHIGS